MYEKNLEGFTWFTCLMSNMAMMRFKSSTHNVSFGIKVLQHIHYDDYVCFMISIKHSLAK